MNALLREFLDYWVEILEKGYENGTDIRKELYDS